MSIEKEKGHDPEGLCPFLPATSGEPRNPPGVYKRQQAPERRRPAVSFLSWDVVILGIQVPNEGDIGQGLANW